MVRKRVRKKPCFPTHCRIHVPVVCTALTAACKLIGPDLINAVLPGAIELLTHPKELVRKKAVTVLHRFEQLDPDHDGPLRDVDLGKHFKQALCDKVALLTTVLMHASGACNLEH